MIRRQPAGPGFTKPSVSHYPISNSITEITDMSEEEVIRYCSPTLAGLKTANLLNCYYKSRSDMLRSVSDWNRRLSSKGVRVLPLRYRNGTALIYVYRPSLLSRDICNSDACKILSDRGYSVMNCSRCIARLIQRISDSDEFPHEIGLFLGYPPEDVLGFIEHRACGCKCTGCWKVYGNKEHAEKVFSAYKKCTAIYHKQWSDGKPIERLTVTV